MPDSLRLGERALCAQPVPARCRPRISTPAPRGARGRLGGRAVARPRRSDTARAAAGRRLRPRPPPRRAAGFARRCWKAPSRAAARPDPSARWRDIAVDDAAGVIRRPPGVEFDAGGTGKGLAADLVATLVGGDERFAIDCGGDLRVGGAGALAEPFDVLVRHPLTGEVAHALQITAGGVATSGLDVRLWRDASGRPAHHLLDPGTGRPAWTGLVGATALAPTALEAEVLAKTALLAGPRRGPGVLARHGGLVVRDDGEVEPVGCLKSRVVVRFSRAAPAA